MLKIILILLSTISFLYANNSSITIEGDIHGGINKGSGTINNNHFDVELKLINKRVFTQNITNVIKQDPKLLKEFRQQFHSIKKKTIKLESLNLAQKKVLKAIQLQLTKNGELLEQQQRILNTFLGDIKLSVAYIKNVTTETNIIVKEMQTRQQQTLKEVQSLNDKLDKPAVIDDVLWHNSNFCKGLNFRRVSEISVFPNLLASNKIKVRREEEAKIYCLKELFKPYQNTCYKIQITAPNQEVLKTIRSLITHLKFKPDVHIPTTADFRPSSQQVDFQLICIAN